VATVTAFDLPNDSALSKKESSWQEEYGFKSRPMFSVRLLSSERS